MNTTHRYYTAFRLLLVNCALLIGPFAFLAQSQAFDAKTVESTIKGNLYCVDFVSDAVGFAVGDEGAILRSDDGGRSWQAISSGNTRALFAIDFVDARIGYAVGAGGTILRSDNGGLSWQKVKFDKVYDFKAIRLFNDNTGLIGGTNFAVNRATGAFANVSDRTINWNLKVPSPMHGIEDIHFVDAGIGYAVGACMDLGPCEATIIKTEDGGNSWTSIKTGFYDAFLSVWFSDERTGYAVGTGGSIIKTDDGGQSWSKVKSGTSNTLHCVRFVNRQSGYIVGENGIILTTSDGGISWQQQSAGVEHTLLSLAINRNGEGIAVGSGGTIVRLNTR